MVMRDQHPHANVELSLVDQQRLLDVFLDHKDIRFYHCDCRLLAGCVQFAVRFFARLSVLTRLGCLLLGLIGWLLLCTCLNFNTHSVIVDEFLQLFDRIEESDASSPIEIVWLQNPNVLPRHHGVPQWELLIRFCFCLQIRMGWKCLINCRQARMLMLLNRVKVELESVKFGVNLRPILIIDHECNRQDIKCIFVHWFCCFLHWKVYLVFLSDAVMVFKVIDKILLAMFTQELKFDALWVWCPLKVEQSDADGDLLPAWTTSIHHSLHDLVVVALHEDISICLIIDWFLRCVSACNIRILGLNFFFLSRNFNVCLFKWRQFVFTCYRRWMRIGSLSTLGRLLTARLPVGCRVNLNLWLLGLMPKPL